MLVDLNDNPYSSLWPFRIAAIHRWLTEEKMRTYLFVEALTNRETKNFIFFLTVCCFNFYTL